MNTINNSLIKKSEEKKPLTNSDFFRLKTQNILTPIEQQRFVASIITVMNNNPAIAECDKSTILSSALLGEALKLSPSPQLGQYYIVPFKDRNNNRITAQFQLGYKGYIQLAIRSGQYKNINVVAIKEGELINYNPLTEELQTKFIEDDGIRENTKTTGYYAMFELANGFRKSIYWSKKKMEAHAKKYSQGYQNDIKKNTSYTFWSKDFDGMAFKTLLRQLISKWGIMSIEMNEAFVKDMGVIKEDGGVEYPDNQNENNENAEFTIKPAETVDQETGEVKENLADGF